MKSLLHGLYLVPILVLAGCGSKEVAEKPQPKKEPPVKPPARVTNRPANPNGGVLIIEYHKVAKEEARWDRSIRKFKNDLARLYKMGFRPVLLSQYLDGKMDLPPGASPVIFTFDDSHPSQIKLVDGKLDPNCALGLWDYFATQHPDFPIKATFFVLPDSGPWGPKADVDAKLKMVKDWGCELGSHTLTHRALSKISPTEVDKELKGAVDWIKAHDFDPKVIALPYGISPKDPKQLAKYHRAALLVGANPAPSPTDPKRNLMRLPRIQCIDGEMGLTYWLDLIEKGKTKVYVQP